MDFVIGLPHSHCLDNSIWIIGDILIKSVHFLLVHMSYATEDYVKLYIRDSVRFHGVPLSNISDKGTQFTPQF